ncbi:aspartate/tyrosine/aromatic aminotransferase [Pseudomonas sp. GM21]|uniref:pyridoxal phosphate-dependent aminotransferase n=1 Tax=Pseudomonas sp. GM21 TaxID=1144325 RepID=UPI00027275A1|nr:pyridoxal phosphate-dependent aminotransferase [Pseudomonas sp. GM21]EJM13182.1 aspartate/tyrosine/aromatic aminotransferase [Pseudomonas sp. GM21]
MKTTIDQQSVATRMNDVAPFHVIDILTRAKRLEAEGRDIVHMEVGEPDFPTPPAIIAAAQAAIANGKTTYTPALGIPELREAIADYYQSRYGVTVPASRVIVTAGASGGLLLALACLAEPGKEWLLTDPGYPCNRNFVRIFEGVPKSIPVGEESNFQPTLGDIEKNWSEATAGVLLASPANPTGTMLSLDQIKTFADCIREKGGHFILDEIYQGLTYDVETSTALQCCDDVWIVQSFSKYFQMTGWRLGWLVVPEEFTRHIEKLAQNLFLSPSAPAQYAALAAFEHATLDIVETRRMEFKRRRDYLSAELTRIGFQIVAKPEGAFYIYADCSAFTDNSFDFAMTLLEHASVAIAPGLDFGANEPERYVRFSYTTSIERLAEAVARIERYLSKVTQISRVV